MEPHIMFAGVKEYGLGIVMALAMTSLLFIIIKWTLATTKEILEQAAKERECFRATIDGLNKAIDNHTQRGVEFHTSVVDAHRYQREEHEKMITKLNEITITLGRINGYKNHKES